MSFWGPLEQAIRARKRVALTTHVAPDGDGLGSALALKYGLDALGVASDIVVVSPVSRRYAFMDPGKAIHQYPTQVDRAWLASFDAVAVLDCSDWHRIGALTDAFPKDALKICIDHHASFTNFADVSVSRVSATATGELVYEFICEHLGLPLDAKMALPLYVSLYTDSGGFRFSNTTARAHHLAAKCLEMGVEPAMVNIALNESNRLSTLKLAARGLEKLEMDPSGKLAWIALSPEDFKWAGATADDIGALIDYPRSLEGVEVALLMFEDEPSSTKVSFRSKSILDMNKLASQFGGGGHVRAAGALLKMDVATARERLLAAARAALSTL
jgi:phosphoesterase RecJ-like protein